MNGDAAGAGGSPACGQVLAAKVPAGIKLCRLDEIVAPGARNFVLEISGKYFHGFIVRTTNPVENGARISEARDEIFGYVDSCPHAGVPLAMKLDEYLTPGQDFITCAWHGAIFEIKNGRCVGGPCVGQSLRPWPVRIESGHVVTA